MKASIIQFDIIAGDIATNEKKAAYYIEKAALEGAETVVLPELWNCGYDLPNLPNLAQNMRGSSIRLLQKLAKKHHLFIFGGSIAEKKNNKYYNTAVIIDNEGNITAKYRKIHLFPLAIEENKFLTSGKEWCIVDTPWGRAGQILCYDLRFPELIRNLVLRGAEMLIVPAQWPELREKHWAVLNQVRAIENQIFVLAANRTGSDKSGIYPGHSLIIDPWGEILAESDNKEGIISAEIDFGIIGEAANKIPILSDRHRILDEIDDSQI
jgi:predicted amidohydrolase